MIEKKEKKGDVTIYYVDKDYGDDKLEKVMNKKLKRTDIKDFIDDDADVYTKDGKLLLRFRKNKLKKDMTDEFYENIINFASEIIEETVKSSKKANQIQIYKFLSKLKDYLSTSELANLGIRPSDNFIKSQLVLAMSHGVTLTLCNNDFMGLADKVINELFHTNMIME